MPDPMKKICGAVHVERWESDGKPREREVRCTLPPGHAGRHGWEHLLVGGKLGVDQLHRNRDVVLHLDKGEPSK